MNLLTNQIFGCLTIAVIFIVPIYLGYKLIAFEMKQDSEKILCEADYLYICSHCNSSIIQKIEYIRISPFPGYVCGMYGLRL